MCIHRALWPGVVVVAWAGALVAAIAVDDSLYVPVGVLVTLLAGALIDRWWAVAVPWGALAVAFAIAFALDPDCSECGEDPWNLQLLYGAILFALPAMIAMAIGVGVRRAVRLARRGSPPRARPVP